ncbi:uncharacterized protein BDR25DRAFT_360575 [Lindgomyces ingoldianus]|uniref:Uncharacterized protein n=1 Tax=Lindgomyces ingoldianus TaxID=673940 RepID=A0ACB6QF88_9PLEO|nr:uncharacterized protein BDR25DRAFT_360575 [Lindgomyces ingoldianus]KAF2465643.1 hypothetical protein BDR25DRAFT_360575 [Lindgomyces ingoldianus]
MFSNPITLVLSPHPSIVMHATRNVIASSHVHAHVSHFVPSTPKHENATTTAIQNMQILRSYCADPKRTLAHFRVVDRRVGNSRAGKILSLFAGDEAGGLGYFDLVGLEWETERQFLQVRGWTGLMGASRLGTEQMGGLWDGMGVIKAWITARSFSIKLIDDSISDVQCRYNCRSIISGLLLKTRLLNLPVLQSGIRPQGFTIWTITSICFAF